MKLSDKTTKREAKGIVIFTDGSSRGNPGPGGWGAVIIDTDKGQVIELGGHESKTTNNRMELTAIGQSLAKVLSSNQSLINH